jgi:protein involved in polysaccharide export with SLBB domain
MLGTAPLVAQQIDPRVLERVQGQLGAGTSPGQQLDTARESGAARGAPAEVLPGATAEELELRRQRSRLELEEFYVASPVEREYQERLGDPGLRLFGYDLFRSTEGGGSGPLTGEVGNGYVLGVGDELVVTFQGAQNDSRTARVDREGRLIVGQLPPIRAAGRSLGAVRSDLAAATRRTLLGTEVYVSLGSVRAISIFVGGEVERPGQYQLTSLGDVATALSRAGGVRRSGSLRRVRVVRGGSSISVDLYGLLGIGGSAATVRLQDGDRIIVPVIGDTAAIAGGVARPGIYELRGGVSLGELIAYAGGAIRPRGNQTAISRIGADGTESFIRAASQGQAIQPGDAVTVVGGSAGGTAGRVLLRGFVQNPGPRPLAVSATVRELLGSPSELRLGTYMPMAILVRRDPLTAARVYEPVNLISALRDSPSVGLRSDDRLYVFGQSDINFLNGAAVRRIVLGQRNPLPRCQALDRLEDIVADTQSARFTAITRGTFILRRDGRNDLASGSGALSAQGLRNADRQLSGGRDETQLNVDELRIARSRGLTPEQYEAALLREERRTEQARRQQQDADTLDGRDETIRERLERRREEQRVGRTDMAEPEECPSIFEEDPELLPVLIEHAVGIGGAVRRPGAYPLADQASADAMIAVAQGATLRLEDATLDVTRSTSTSATTERVPVDAGRTAMARVTLRAGDDLRLNAGQPQYETGAVLLSGEFQRPGLYTVRKGETLSQLIARAGGLSSQAYPYGAVFTRTSVKELQQEGINRTVRELNTALLAAASRRRDAGGADLLGASQLVREIANVEAQGRVVIEADPRVLTVRQDLDTVLEAGDAIYMPKRPNFVLVLGDVNSPGALQFISDKDAAEYLREAGGALSTADDGRAFLVLPNGTAQPLRSSAWRRNGSVVPPGSTIIVPKNIDPLRRLDLIRDVTQIIAQVVSSVGTIAILATNN